MFFRSRKHTDETLFKSFFLDRKVVPIEINIDRDLNKSELREIFESIRQKIGEPRYCEFTEEKQEEIMKWRNAIALKLETDKQAAESLSAQRAFDEKEKKIRQWVSATGPPVRVEFFE